MDFHACVSDLDSLFFVLALREKFLYFLVYRFKGMSIIMKYIRNDEKIPNGFLWCN